MRTSRMHIASLLNHNIFVWYQKSRKQKEKMHETSLYSNIKSTEFKKYINQSNILF